MKKTFKQRQKDGEVRIIQFYAEPIAYRIYQHYFDRLKAKNPSAKITAHDVMNQITVAYYEGHRDEFPDFNDKKIYP